MAGEPQPPSPPAVLSRDLPAADLAQLAAHGDPHVRAAVAGHPNTPALVLGQLAAEFPREVLRNPALPLLRLADPQLLRAWPTSAFQAFLRQPELPAWIRTFLIRHGPVEQLVLLAARPDLSAPEVALLATHPAWLVRARIAARPELPQALLLTLTDDPDYGVRLALASRTDLPVQSVNLLRRDTSRFVRQVLEQTQRLALAVVVLGTLPWR